METKRIFVHLTPGEHEFIDRYAEAHGLRWSGTSETVRQALKLLEAVDSGRVRVTRVAEDGTEKDVMILA